MKHLLTLTMLLVAFLSNAQNVWNWPEDQSMYSQAQEKQVYYKKLMGQEKFDKALVPLQWLYDNNASLNPSIYIDGTKCAEELIKSNSNKEKIAKLQEKSLWMYDQRIKHFDKPASVLDRKAYTAFKYYYKTPRKYPLLFEMFQSAVDANDANISTFNLVPYMTVAKYGYDWKLSMATKKQVLDIHSQLHSIMDKKEQAGENMKESRDKVDALFSSLDGLLTCDFIEENLVPRFNQNPNDAGTAKKIVAYSLQAKCSDQVYFLEAGEALLKNEPSYKFARIIADKRFSRGEFDQANELYSTALGLAKTDEEKYNIQLAQAKVASKQGQKTKSRSLAIKALNTRPSEKEPYNLIGNLYMGSFNDCAKKDNMVDDRALFILAYKMYEKAGNYDQMSEAKKQFPSKEDIFTANKKAGDVVKVECWINESVAIQARG